MRTTVALILVLAAASAVADTFYLKNGTRLDGKPIADKGDLYIVQAGNREIAVRKSEIARYEKNDKTGVFDKQAARAAWEERQAELQKIIKLTPDQVTRIREILTLIRSSDESTSTRGRLLLVQMGKEVDVFPFFDYYLTDYSPSIVPGVLQALVMIDPKRSVPVLREFATSLPIVNRATAIELLGVAGDGANSDLVARALIDGADEVRIAGALSVRALSLAAATPLLLDNLGSGSPRVRMASLQTLKSVWSTPEKPLEYASAEEWRQHWLLNEGQAGRPYRAEGLAPLVDPSLHWEDE